MTRFAVSGAGGFLGWHLRSSLLERGIQTSMVALGDAFDVAQASGAISGSDRAIHLAGVNRGSDEDVAAGNIKFAEQFALALRKADIPPKTVVFANSIQAENGSNYGESKARASDVLELAARDIGAEYVNILLPNLFGEHGKPFYNSVTATFCHLISMGEKPTVDNDKELSLMHVQDAADLLTGEVSEPSAAELLKQISVSGLLHRVQQIAEVYTDGEIPDISTKFDRDLFNTYRSFTFPSKAQIALVRHADDRGSFFENIRSHGGTGQSSFSTTVPGVTRGDHFHRRKVERFTVIGGEARISLRRLFTTEVVHFDVTGENPVAIDMPTLWAHNITNTGTELLYTSFWTNDIFDPTNPDTIPEEV